MTTYERIGIFVLGLFVGVCLSCAVLFSARAEDEYPPLYVTATQLNGRYRPSRRAFIEARFERGDQIQQTGRFSADREWVEVYGGEAGTCWVSIKYVTEENSVFMATNEDYARVKIRSKPENGKVIGYVKRGQSVEIDQVVLGWGHCRRGWVYLSFFE